MPRSRSLSWDRIEIGATRHERQNQENTETIESAKSNAPLFRIVRLAAHGSPLRSSLRVVMLWKGIAIKSLNMTAVVNTEQLKLP